MSKSKSQNGKTKTPAPPPKAGTPQKKTSPAGSGKQPEERNAPAKAGPAAALPLAPPKESKLDMVVKLLRRPEGATIDDLAAATNWQKHTIRACLSHALAKKRGYQIVSDRPSPSGYGPAGKQPGGQRVYKIAEDA